MIEHMDEGIGRVVAALEATGVADDTLVVFTSDNGGERFSDNWPLVGGKMDLIEGGIRVPWIAHWPARIAPGGDERAALHDDGLVGDHARGRRRRAPTRTIRSTASRCCRCSTIPAHRFARPLYWRMKHRDQRALRDGDWKYLKVDDHEYLFDVPADERERANLGKREPGAAGRDARRLGGMERHHAADSRRRHREPRLRREGHAAALALLPLPRCGRGRAAVATIDGLIVSPPAMPAAEEPRVDAAPVRRFRDPNYRPQAATLGALRERIDALDAQIVALLAAARAVRARRDPLQARRLPGVGARSARPQVFARVRALAAAHAAEFPSLPDVVEAAYRVARRRLHRRRGALLRRNRTDRP